MAVVLGRYLHEMLGLNVNRGSKICLRLRYPGDSSQFLPLESVVDTMLHELCHIVHGPHNADFHALWDQLRDEQQGLIMKGYTGEGFLSEGRRLGGRGKMPAQEARRLAREAAEKRRRQPGGTGSGIRLGGAVPRPGQDIRRVIADAAERRKKTLEGCGTDKLTEVQIRDMADAATRNGFRTQAEEDEANEVAIAQALWELVQEDEQKKKAESSSSSTNAAVGDLLGRQEAAIDVLDEPSSSHQNSSQAGDTWVCQVCTLHNPLNFLCCDACGTERGSPDSAAQTKTSQAPTATSAPTRTRTRSDEVIDLTSSPPQLPPREPKRRQTGSTSRTVSAEASSSAAEQMWQCSFCGQFMERKWWTCSTCGLMKDHSR